MSRIREKLSKIFASQIPEFIRAGEYAVTNIQIVSTTASSKIVVVGDTFDIIAGDRLQHPAITNTVFVTKILSTTKLEVSNAIAVTLTNQTAKFIRADSTSTFVKFLEAYYKFLEQDQGPQEVLQNVRKYGDSEYTTDALIDQFFKNYGNDIPRNIVTDKRNFIKHFKDIYKTKGTEEAYKLLFRIMFNSNAEFFYPSEVVLKPSDGVWKYDYTIKVSEVSGYNPFDFVNTKIVGQTSNASAIVGNVLKVINGQTEVYELYLENVKGIFVQENIIAKKLLSVGTTPTTIIATTVPQIIKIEILNSVPGYEPGKLIRIFGGGYARITDVDLVGKIKGVKVIESSRYGAISFPGGIIAPITDMPPPSIVSTGNVILLSNIGQYSSNVAHGLSKGSVANISFSNLPNIAENTITVTSILDSKRFIFNYYSPNINSNVNIELVSRLKHIMPANLFANVGVLKESSGYWLNNKGKLSELVYVQGPALNSVDRSKIFYQPYSYVVKSDVSIGEWAATAAQLVHPAGTQVFGEIDINKEISGNLEPTGTSEVWDYFGLTADSNIFLASLTTYTNSRVANLSITADMVYTLFGYL
jgi:hypothetical protein